MPHIHELYDFTVTPFIVFEDKVLFVNHPKYGMWIPPGGHVELDQDPDEALMAEIVEETGLEVEILNPKPKAAVPDRKFLYTPSFMDVHDANPPHRHIALIYFAIAKSGKFTKSDEHDDMRWLSGTELDDPDYNIAEGNKFYAREAIKLAKNT
jgi:ADP-ribose pyrophosphatase YjhB (NUDIX family)